MSTSADCPSWLCPGCCATEEGKGHHPLLGRRVQSRWLELPTLCPPWLEKCSSALAAISHAPVSAAGRMVMMDKWWGERSLVAMVLPLAEQLAAEMKPAARCQLPLQGIDPAGKRWARPGSRRTPPSSTWRRRGLAEIAVLHQQAAADSPPSSQASTFPASASPAGGRPTGGGRQRRSTIAGTAWAKAEKGALRITRQQEQGLRRPASLALGKNWCCRPWAAKSTYATRPASAGLGGAGDLHPPPPLPAT